VLSRSVAPPIVALLIGFGAATCDRGTGLPDAASPAYAEAVAAFYTGVAAIQVGATDLAETVLRRVTELAPGEPAGWVNLAVIALQRRELAAAEDRLAHARSLAPDNSHIELVSALVARERGDLEAASQHLRRAIDLDPGNVKALYLLAHVIEQEGEARTAEAAQLVDRLVEAEPGNLVALFERARLAAKQQDGATLRRTVDRLAREVGPAPRLAAPLQALRSAGEAGRFRDAAIQIAFVETELASFPAYVADRDALVPSPGGADVVLTAFLRLPVPSGRPAPPDTGLVFESESLSLGGERVAWVRASWIADEGPLALLASNRETVWVSTAPGDVRALPVPGGVAAVATLDYDYDFRPDLALAGPGGLRLLRQDDTGSFTDVTAAAIPAAAARTPSAGVWAADLDMEGDMDLVLGRSDGPPLVLRNRGDARFEPRDGFAGVSGVRDFVWADFDADGDPDAALLDAAGRLHVFANTRSASPQFRRQGVPDTLGTIHALAVGDLNQDATLDLVLLHADGRVSRLSMGDRGWDVALLARWPEFPTPVLAGTRLFVADLDNNGGLDLAASLPHATRVWLSTDGAFRAHPPLDLHVTDVADFGLGRLNLVGVTASGEPRWLANRGTKDYYSTSIRPRASAVGDRRVNAFGIGGEIEIRAGLLYQKQAITSPAVHFGLGEHPVVNVARIIWPNGSVQAEFNLAGTNQAILMFQRLKGSCPWVFAFDGREMRFVTDFLWRTALGLRINAQGEAAVIHAEDWVRIRGDQLVAHDGFYDVRITAELWETHFIDHVALLVVDHPVGTEAFVDERFTLPSPEPAVHLAGPLRALARAWDHEGRDVTAVLRDLDERYVDAFPLGRYQGIAPDHYVEVDLGDDAPARGPLWLVASGWVYPTDASINVAASQGDHARPRGVQVEVADGSGGWSIVNPDLGFPAGKTKTILIDLEDAFRPGTPHRVRLRTNMEIYWDRIAWAVGRPDAASVTRRLLPATAELRYRGFSAVRQAGRRSPELPEYGRIAAAVPQWRDLVGYHTRLGDVRDLTRAVDDRFVIMNAGDELVLRFPALPPPARGWTRDFVLIGDGWVKDGDYNTGFSTTVLPLPYHGLTEYERPPGRLEDDPAYRLHAEDWTRFHTRYVTPRTFHRALVPHPSR
jgi:hypothetical protein